MNFYKATCGCIIMQLSPSSPLIYLLAGDQLGCPSAMGMEAREPAERYTPIPATPAYEKAALVYRLKGKA